MSGDRRHRQLLYPSWKVPNPTSTPAILTVLFGSSLSQSLLGQTSNVKLNVPTSVSVPEGLCVHIPCNFTYDAPGKTSSRPIRGYWFQKKDGYQHFWGMGTYFFAPGILVATNDEREKLQTSVEHRFQLTGDPEGGDCSFRILNARLQDTAGYYFLTDNNNIGHNNFLKPLQVPSTLQVLVTELTEKPEIVISSAVIPGKEAAVSCSAPGPCSGTNPKIHWAPVLAGYKLSPWSRQHIDGRWIYGSNFTFTPSLSDQGKPLTCQVWYPDIRKQIKNTILLVVAGSQSEPSGPSVTLFVIILCLIKILVCLLFFFSMLWFMDQRRLHVEGSSQ